MAVKTREFHLVARPQGLPKASDFALIERDLDDAADGQVMIENHFISVDPYMRPPMSMEVGGTPLDQPLFGAALGKVIQSKAEGIKEGDLVTHGVGWRDNVVLPAAAVQPVPDINVPLSAHMGPLGMTGLTAYGGILEIGQIKEGDTVFVSGASGAVGSMVCQISKIKGCTVIGSAGSDAKVEHLKTEYGADFAFNYKTASAMAELPKAAPKGIDVYFDNVGGDQLAAALIHSAVGGRIAICGMIASYNDGGSAATAGPSLNTLAVTIYKRLTLRGFVVTEFEPMRSQFLSDMAGWIKDGSIKYQETIVEGLENTPEAFTGLFTGANDGKMLVKLGDSI